MRGLRDTEDCRQIDDDAVELHAMYRLPEGWVREHLDACPFCRERVIEWRSYIGVLREALREVRPPGDSLWRDAGEASRPGESPFIRSTTREGREVAFGPLRSFAD